MPHTFIIPSRFRPSYSLLGRAIRRQTGDRLRAEAVFILALTGIGLAFFMGYQIAWAFVAPSVQAAPTGPEALAFWSISSGALLLGLCTCIIGFEPAVTVACTPRSLQIEKGRQHLTLPYRTITEAKPVGSLVFHRHYRRYAATHVFIGPLDGPVLLLRSPRTGPVALGLSEDDQAALLKRLRSQQPSVSNGRTHGEPNGKSEVTEGWKRTESGCPV